MKLHPLSEIGPKLFSAGIVLMIFLFLSGPAGFWSMEHGAIVSFKSGLIIYVPLLLIGAALNRRRPLYSWINPEIFTLLLALIFFSDWLNRAYNLFQGPNIRGELILGGLITFGLVWVRATSLFTIAAPLLSILCAVLFWKELNGKLLFSDDLATFFYRLDLLKSQFPAIPFYNPEWNGGIDQRDFFATGALSPFFIFSPLIYLFDLKTVFNLIITLILFVITPLGTFFAARIAKLDLRVSSIAALLVMSSGLVWYRWAISYGTLGFLISIALLPLVFALVYSYINSPKNFSLFKEISLVVLLSTMLLWSPSGICLIPTIIWGLLRITHLPFIRTQRIGLALVAINLPWILLFMSVSKVGSFLHSENKAPINVSSSTTPSAPSEATPVHIKHSTHKVDYERSSKGIREWAISTNPLILAFLIPGILLLPQGWRIITGVQILWLFSLGVFVPAFKPQLEFDRMLLVAGQLAALPCSVAIGFIISNAANSRRVLPYISASIVGAFILISLPSIGAIIERRSLIQYFTLEKEDQDMITFLKDLNTPGRILFSGCVLHEFAGGHLAPLSSFTGKNFIASSHVHNIWRYKDVIPPEFLKKGDSGIEEFFNLYNVTIVAAHEKRWRSYFLENRDRYKEIWRGAGFLFFERLGVQPSYILSGSAELKSQTRSSISFTMQSEEAVIKFNYLPFLESDNCKISPYPIESGQSLIKIEDCRVGEEVNIDGGSPWHRIEL